MSKRNVVPFGSVLWGVWDTQDQCWLGTNAAGTGPKVFDYLDVARVAAQLVGVQMGWPPKRTEARRYDGSGTKLKDELAMKMGTREALKKVQDGQL